ncbi:MAG: indolepyruvate ferredoxin oxidoreductase family protein [Pseudonocardia sp.]|nr:indolepyruvate ferredoxin oxidoreductase family protein [Pseudonocardia sp.]
MPRGISTVERGVVDHGYRLADRFDRESGRVYLTGWDALVRLPLMQRRRDELAGLNTAGFVSGYPGSPLGGLDSLFRSQREMLAERHVHFQPGLNEDLAATAVWGTQHAGVGVTSRYEGVFGLWYGKGPGVERSTDAMRTANFQGVSKHGGAIALAGDDHNARSTVTAQQSETLFIHMHMPILNPATVQDYLDYGLAGWALSRFAGSWVGMICLNDTADSSASVLVDPARPHLVVPADGPVLPPFGTPRPGGGVAGAVGLEREIRGVRLPAAQAFVRANGLDRVELAGERRGTGRHGLGIVASGKAFLDVQEGLARLGLTPERAAGLGISVYKVAMPWPLEPEGILEFADGLDELLVVEPKHPVMEDQIGRLLRQVPRDRRPDLVGKTDETGQALVPEAGGLDAVVVSKVLLKRIERLVDDPELVASLRPRESLTLLSAGLGEKPGLVRAAGFCSGCPHNTSTQVPDGSFAIGGTGCHGMAGGMGDPMRPTRFNAHMGGEGALWIGMAPFADEDHVFQNMGDGTYSHSGALAIRAAIATGTTMTFKILLNGYISMTGGQSIPGGLTAQAVAAQVLAEGAREVVVVSDDVAKYRSEAPFPAGVSVHDRDELIAVQERIRTVPGVTVLVYDQACAAELRRERKRGNAVDPDKRVIINDAVCEGCGDCNVASNCISVEPLDTDLGRKRTINQSSCNKDFSCLSGYCPSFVTLEGATPRRRGGSGGGTPAQLPVDLPVPAVADASGGYNVLIGGIGGGGVLTLGALLGMAAHLEGKAVTVLNESGLAQKNGAVQSHVRVSADPRAQLAARIGERSADLVLGADMVVVAGADPLATMDRDRTTAVVNDRIQPTVAFARNGALDLSGGSMAGTLRRATDGRADFVDAAGLATALMGDSIYANLFLLGYAAQKGLLPVGIGALEQAIEINGVAVARNHEALRWGRVAAHDLAALPAETADEPLVAEETAAPEPVTDLIARRRAFLAAYQDTAYAARFERALQPVLAAERERTPGHDELSRAAVEGLFKLMSYKDEYEVARLYTTPEFRRRLAEEFEGSFTWSVNLAPQILNRRDSRTGRAKKWEIPSTVIMPAFRVLAGARRLRGTRLDVFGRTAHRQAERARIGEYEQVLTEIAARLGPANHGVAVQLAALPDMIRGYDTIKDESAALAKEKEATLLDELRAAGSPA